MKTGGRGTASHPFQSSRDTTLSQQMKQGGAVPSHSCVFQQEEVWESVDRTKQFQVPDLFLAHIHANGAKELRAQLSSQNLQIRK